MNEKSRILESKNLEIYKRLIRVLGEYSKNVPATGVDHLFDQVVEQGIRVLPKEKFALAILDYILCEKDIPNTVQTLLNIRFSDLPVKMRPMLKRGRRHGVAFWSRGGRRFDCVRELLNLEGAEGSGKWTDLNGEAVQLIDLTKEEKKGQ